MLSADYITGVRIRVESIKPEIIFLQVLLPTIWRIINFVNFLNVI